MYLAGSRSHRAFRSAMALPSPPPPDWGWAAEVVRTTGRLPKDDPENWFPAGALAEWFLEAGYHVDDKALQAAADGLLTAKGQLFVSVAFQFELRANALHGRDHVGPAPALRKELKAIKNSAERIQVALKAIRGEILLRRANGVESNLLEMVHWQLHEAFREGQLSRQLATGRSYNAGDFDPNAEIGSQATLASTWLENGLASLRASVEVANLLDTPSATKSKGKQRLKRARDRFIQDVAEVWWKATGTRPTVQTRDDQVTSDGRSAFQHFHEHVCGHVAGLHLRAQQIDWDQLSKPERDAIRNDFRSLGLWNVSSPTLAQLVRGIKFDPIAPGSNDTPDEDRRG